MTDVLTILSKARLMDDYIRQTYKRTREDVETEKNLINFLQNVSFFLENHKCAMKKKNFEASLSTFRNYDSKRAFFQEKDPLGVATLSKCHSQVAYKKPDLDINRRSAYLRSSISPGRKDYLRNTMRDISPSDRLCSNLLTKDSRINSLRNRSSVQALNFNSNSNLHPNLENTNLRGSKRSNPNLDKSQRKNSKGSSVCVRKTLLDYQLAGESKPRQKSRGKREHSGGSFGSLVSQEGSNQRMSPDLRASIVSRSIGVQDQGILKSAHPVAKLSSLKSALQKPNMKENNPKEKKRKSVSKEKRNRAKKPSSINIPKKPDNSIIQDVASIGRKSTSNVSPGINRLGIPSAQKSPSKQPLLKSQPKTKANRHNYSISFKLVSGGGSEVNEEDSKFSSVAKQTSKEFHSPKFKDPYFPLFPIQAGEKDSNPSSKSFGLSGPILETNSNNFRSNMDSSYLLYNKNSPDSRNSPVQILNSSFQNMTAPGEEDPPVKNIQIQMATPRSLQGGDLEGPPKPEINSDFNDHDNIDINNLSQEEFQKMQARQAKNSQSSQKFASSDCKISFHKFGNLNQGNEVEKPEKHYDLVSPQRRTSGSFKKKGLVSTNNPKNSEEFVNPVTANAGPCSPNVNPIVERLNAKLKSGLKKKDNKSVGKKI